MEDFLWKRQVHFSLREAEMIRLICHLANPGTNFANVPTVDLFACMTKCANTAGCVSVNFSTGDKICYMRNYQ